MLQQDSVQYITSVTGKSLVQYITWGVTGKFGTVYNLSVQASLVQYITSVTGKEGSVCLCVHICTHV